MVHPGVWQPSYLEAVVADDADEGDDRVQHGQEGQRGLHVARALLQVVKDWDVFVIVVVSSLQPRSLSIIS